MTLPDQYKWLLSEPGPKMILEFLNIYGVHEFEGSANNPVIMGWAKELGISWYTADATPWCGLEMGIVAKRAGHPFDPNKILSALAWATFGQHVDTDKAMFGDILIFRRTGGGHVGLYIGEDSEAFHVGGGNQSDQSDIARIAKGRLYAVRRPNYDIQPPNVRKIILSSSGQLSQNEA